MIFVLIYTIFMPTKQTMRLFWLKIKVSPSNETHLLLINLTCLATLRESITTFYGTSPSGDAQQTWLGNIHSVHLALRITISIMFGPITITIQIMKLLLVHTWRHYLENFFKQNWGGLLIYWHMRQWHIFDSETVSRKTRFSYYCY